MAPPSCQTDRMMTASVASVLRPAVGRRTAGGESADRSGRVAAQRAHGLHYTSGAPSSGRWGGAPALLQVSRRSSEGLKKLGLYFF